MYKPNFVATNEATAFPVRDRELESRFDVVRPYWIENKSPRYLSDDEIREHLKDTPFAFWIDTIIQIVHKREKEYNQKYSKC